LKEKYEIPNTISLEANHLIISMLKIDFKERITLKECFEHPWINGKLLPDEWQNSLIREKINNDSCKKRKSIAPEFKTPKNSGLTEKISFGSRSFIRSNNEKEKTVKLPSLMTKLTPDFEENMLYDYNFSIVRQFNGKIPNFLMPIGHTKKLKQKNLKILNFISNGFELMKKNEIKQNTSDSKIETKTSFKKHKSISLIPTSTVKNFMELNHKPSYKKMTIRNNNHEILYRTSSKIRVFNSGDKSLNTKEILLNQTLSGMEKSDSREK
jgi:serine/threonine protein kinase